MAREGMKGRRVRKVEGKGRGGWGGGKREKGMVG